MQTQSIHGLGVHPLLLGLLRLELLRRGDEGPERAPELADGMQRQMTGFDAVELLSQRLVHHRATSPDELLDVSDQSVGAPLP